MRNKIIGSLLSVAFVGSLFLTNVSAAESEETNDLWIFKLSYDYLDATASGIPIGEFTFLDDEGEQSGSTHGATVSLGRTWGEDNLVMIDATFRGGDLESDYSGAYGDEGYSDDADLKESDIRVAYQKLWGVFQPFVSIGYNSIEFTNEYGNWEQTYEYDLFAFGVGTGIKIYANEWVQVSGKLLLDYMIGEFSENETSAGSVIDDGDGDADGYRYRISVLANFPFMVGEQPLSFFVDAGYQETNIDWEYDGSSYEDSGDYGGPFVRTGIVMMF